MLGLVDAELKTMDDSSQKSRRSTDSKCDALFGLAAGLSAQLNFTENLFLIGAIEYDWWSDKASLRTGDAAARIELSDYSVSLGLGLEF